MDFEAVLARCIEKWRGEGIALSPPVEEAEVSRAWDGFGKRASEEVIRFYGTIGGFAVYEWDDSLGTFWPWGYVLERNVDYPGDGVIFCDHSYQLITWELRFEDKLQSSVWIMESPPVMAAPSLEAFLRLYLEDPYKLTAGWSPPDDDSYHQRKVKRRGTVVDKSDPLWDETLDG